MSGARWLDPDEQAAWRAFIESTKLVLDALDRQLQHDAAMPLAYYEVLVQLSEAPERTLRMRDLADLTLSSRSRLSHAVARLEQHGWVQRTDCETDRRGQNATLTDQGFATLVAAAPGHVETVRRVVIDGLDAEQLAQLTEIGRLIRMRVQTEPA